MLLSLALTGYLRIFFCYPTRHQSIFLINHDPFLLRPWSTVQHWTKRALFIIAWSTKHGVVILQSVDTLRASLCQTSTSITPPSVRADGVVTVTSTAAAWRQSDHLQRVSVCLRHHHRYTVRKAHSQPLPEHGQIPPLAVAMVTEDDTGALCHGVQHFMVGHFTWTEDIIILSAVTNMTSINWELNNSFTLNIYLWRRGLP